MENLEVNEVSFLTEKDIDQILNSVSDDLIIQNIEEQIENVFSNEVSGSKLYYLSYFTNRYNYITKKYSDNKDIMDRLNKSIIEVFSRVQELIENKFKFSLELIDSLDIDMMMEIIENIYQFFIIDFNTNCSNLVFNYITNERKDLVKSYKNTVNRKDLTYINLKKFITNENIIIIYNIDDIIDGMDIQAIEDIIDLMTKDDPDLVSNYIIRSLFMDEKYGYVTFNESLNKLICDFLKGNYPLKMNIKCRLTNYFNALNMEDK